MKEEYRYNLWRKVWKNEEHKLEVKFGLDDTEEHFSYQIKGGELKWIPMHFPKISEDTFSISEENTFYPKILVFIKFESATSIIVSLPGIPTMKLEVQ